MDPTAAERLRTVEELRFDNRFTRELPADPDPENRRRQVKGAAYSRVRPQRVAAPRLLAWSREMAEVLGFSEEAVRSGAFVEVFSGNRVLDGMDPFAMCYGGHQFGHWAGQLGDGRAINLGQVRGRDGALWMLQLKGAGPTPYSRMADGLAVLRSSVREFLCSEAMHHLGVPTTRALSLVTTGEEVERDMFYDGNPRMEPGAVVCRVARSFTRFGNFEICAARGDLDLLRALADHTLRSDFPHLGEPSKDVYLEWIREVCRTTAELIVQWMSVGFVHGVMNTDNMSILGETIDYGPYGWLEGYDPNWTPNTTDAFGRRYAFGNQPEIAHWNLTKLASSVVPLVGEVDPLQRAMAVYPETFEARWREVMARKLGLASYEPGDEELVFDLLGALQLVETDMTIFLRNLARAAVPAEPSEQDAAFDDALLDAYYDPPALTPEVRGKVGAWLARWRARVRRDGTADGREGAAERRRRMDAANPKYVLRNYLAQLAIDEAEKGDPSEISELLDVLRRPFDEQPGKERFAGKRPEWARERPGCSMLSCSS